MEAESALNRPTDRLPRLPFWCQAAGQADFLDGFEEEGRPRLSRRTDRSSSGPSGSASGRWSRSTVIRETTTAVRICSTRLLGQGRHHAVARG